METRLIRLANLRHLIRQEGAVSQLALRLQISPIYIYRVLDGKFNIGDSMARKIEDAYGFQRGWMDNQGNDLEPLQRQSPQLPRSDHIPLVADAQERVAEERESSPLPGGVSDTRGENNHTTPLLSEALNERLINGIANTLERLLAANGLDISDQEKAKLLMKAAERVLDDQRKTDDSVGENAHNVVKIS